MADIFLKSGDNLTGITFGGGVFGAAGTESVGYTGAAIGIVVDQNVEQVRLAGSTSSYTYQQQGNQLVVFSGSTEVARIAVQGDANGTLVDFANGRVEVRLSSAGLTIGTTTVPTAAPGPVVPAVIDGSGGTGTQTLTLTPGPDTLTASGGSDIFNALTVNAQGAAANTLTAFDNLDGGAGEDTLNIYTDNGAGLNNALPANLSVKNVEIVNILNANGAANIADASKFTGVQQLWQVGFAADVTNLAAGTTAGFRNLDAAVGDIDITAAAAATSVAIALDGLRGANAGNAADLDVDGKALNSVTVSGTLAQKVVNATPASLTLDVTAGKDVQTFSLNTAVNTVLTVTKDGASTKDVTTVDASASAGAVTFSGAATVATIKSGAGADVLTVNTATVKDKTSALVESGAGKDTVTINTSGDGTTTVSAGDGNDTVTLNARGTGKLTVDLGAGDDAFTVTGSAVSAGDLIDGGAGKDTLLLSIVGAANIASFSNFEVFDAKGLNAALDVDILASKNTVTEFVTTGALGANAELQNVGAGIGYRILADTDANDLVFTQKTGGALTITLDVDEAATVGAAFDSVDVDAAVTATNATSVKAVFDSSFFDTAIAGTDNLADLDISAAQATTLEVVSGGANASNDLDFTSAGNKLTSVTVSGSQALNLDLAGSNAVATVNASALTGSLTFDLADLKAGGALSAFGGGTVTLGSGADMLTAATGATISGLQKGTAEDLTKAGAADTIVLTGAVQASDDAGLGYTLANGLLTFTGAGPATLADAFTIAKTAANADNEALVFQYLGDSFIFAEGATDAGVGDDVYIKLSGTTGLAGLDTYAANNVYVF